MKATRRKTLLALVGAMAVGAASAAPSVEITSVQQQYPWTNTVDIVYNVAGVASETNGYFVVFTPTTSTGAEIPDVNGQKSVQVALKGSGVYSTQWFPQTNLQYTACKMTPSVFRGAAKDYMIVDLETGAVTYEPMATQAASNQRYNTQEYKTTKMVLRRVPAGTYAIGGPESTVIHQAINSPHEVTMDGDYYIGVFEVTKAQYDRIVGGTASTDTMPKNLISWNQVRGSALPAARPGSGVLKSLADLTGLAGFDLPTSAMWEVAARAGSTAKWLSGDSTDGLSAYLDVDDSNHHSVGLKQANAWGLYDICGNVWEYTRDVWYDGDYADFTDGFTPISTGNTKRATLVGGASADIADGYSMYRFSSRHAQNKTSAQWTGVGFRCAYVERW